MTMLYGVGNEMDLVTIIVPIYNAETFIEETVKSILTQTYGKLEVILINDGSEDNSKKICQRLAVEDTRIVFVSKENEGVSTTRNLGIKMANGKYVTFVDADDLLPEYAVENMVKVIDGTKYDAVFAQHAYLYEENKLVERLPRVECGTYTYDMLKDKLLDDGTLTGMLFGSVCGALYRRDTIVSNHILFDGSMTVNEDGFFNMEFIRNADQIYVMEKPYVYLYRQWKDKRQVSFEKGKKFDTATQIIKEYLMRCNLLKLYEQQLFKRNVSVAFWKALEVGNASPSQMIGGGVSVFR